jgi:hypothetical protein
MNAEIGLLARGNSLEEDDPEARAAALQLMSERPRYGLPVEDAAAASRIFVRKMWIPHAFALFTAGVGPPTCDALVFPPDRTESRPGAVPATNAMTAAAAIQRFRCRARASRIRSSSSSSRCSGGERTLIPPSYYLY